MSGYWLGQVVHLTFTVEQDEIDTDPSQISLTVIEPDGTVESPVTPVHDGTGEYHYDYAPPRVGIGYRWIAQAIGTLQAVATGTFDVYDAEGTDPPIIGVVQPWCDAASVNARLGGDGLEQLLVDDACRVASELLYGLSGRQFAGYQEATVRPAARPSTADWRSWAVAGGFGWYGSWGTCAYAYGTGYGGSTLAAWAGHSCQLAPPTVELGGYPVISIGEVKIDGQTIPTDEYRLDNRRLLTRVRPTINAQPTVRYGWPTCQRLDLPDTEPGTFSVNYRYGTPPPASGRAAATTLATELALMWNGADDDKIRLPVRIRQVTRQGETVMIADSQDVLDNGRTGIPDVDLFLKNVNPQGMQRRARVWSPDMPMSRRPT